MATSIEQFNATAGVELLKRGDEVIEEDEWSRVSADYALVISGDAIASIEGTKEQLLNFLDRARAELEKG